MSEQMTFAAYLRSRYSNKEIAEKLIAYCQASPEFALMDLLPKDDLLIIGQIGYRWIEDENFIVWSNPSRGDYGVRLIRGKTLVMDDFQRLLALPINATGDIQPGFWQLTINVGPYTQKSPGEFTLIPVIGYHAVSTNALGFLSALSESLQFLAQGEISNV